MNCIKIYTQNKLQYYNTTTLHNTTQLDKCISDWLNQLPQELLASWDQLRLQGEAQAVVESALREELAALRTSEAERKTAYEVTRPEFLLYCCSFYCPVTHESFFDITCFCAYFYCLLMSYPMYCVIYSTLLCSALAQTLQSAHEVLTKENAEVVAERDSLKVKLTAMQHSLME